MRHPISEKLKQLVRPTMYRVLSRKVEQFTCPICNYHGPFKDKKLTHREGAVRRHSKCPNCTSTERHRMLSLVCEELFTTWPTDNKKILHFAPEPCLAATLKKRFQVYHTADLFMPRVDFIEDVQKLTFCDASYDCVLISHVMTSVPDMVAAVRELHRILRPGGIVIIAESFATKETIEYGEQRGDFWREVGLNAIDMFGEYFDEVKLTLSDRFDQKHQLNNYVLQNGHIDDRYPALIRVDGVGYQTAVAVCRVNMATRSRDHANMEKACL